MAWKNINPIIENRLFLGNIMAARSTRSLTENRITHILSVCTDPIPAEVPESGICHLRIPVEDVDYADLLIQMPTACRFIEQSLRSGGVVLVHCGQGLSRSPAIVAAYLMWSKRVGVAAAVDMVRDARDQIWINPGFYEQLALFEMCQYAPSRSNGIYLRWRVTLDNKLAAAGLR
ncbi:protein-tyrosine phosphatase-like protein [Panaeolus papilionaceus]|nr:protein-tyrosine phosphatase-like protein [Panaeolus papilionaceus]